MKKILLILMIAGGFTTCKKDKIALSANIIGKWELHRRYGGNIYPPDTTYQAGNGNILQFNADSTYKNYYGGTLTGEGRFRIVKNAYRTNNEVYDELYFINNVDYTMMAPDIVTTSGNVLTIKPTMPDASTTEYNKLSD